MMDLGRSISDWNSLCPVPSGVPAQERGGHIFLMLLQGGDGIHEGLFLNQLHLKPSRTCNERLR